MKKILRISVLGLLLSCNPYASSSLKYTFNWSEVGDKVYEIIEDKVYEDGKLI